MSAAREAAKAAKQAVALISKNVTISETESERVSMEARLANIYSKSTRIEVKIAREAAKAARAAVAAMSGETVAVEETEIERVMMETRLTAIYSRMR